MNRKRRSLVLTTESARHPFRMGLPARGEKSVEQDWIVPAPPAGTPWRDVLATYVATFLVMTVFLA